MVLGGTLAATMISYHARYVMKTLKSLLFIIFPYHLSPKKLNAHALQVIDWSKINNNL